MADSFVCDKCGIYCLTAVKMPDEATLCKRCYFASQIGEDILTELMNRPVAEGESSFICDPETKLIIEVGDA